MHGLGLLEQVAEHPPLENNKELITQQLQHAALTDRRRNGHTVETGHNVGLTAIASKVIWTPDGRKQNHRREKEGQEEGIKHKERRNATERGAKKKKRKREESRKNMKLEQEQHHGPQRPKRPTVSTSGTQDRKDTEELTAGHRSSV